MRNLDRPLISLSDRVSGEQSEAIKIALQNVQNVQDGTL